MSDYSLQKRLASQIAKVGKSKIRIDSSAKDDLKSAITKADVANLIKEKVITIKQEKGTSRHRARARHLQRKKGRQKGHGARKGCATARTPHKEVWMARIRLLRKILKEFKDKRQLTSVIYRELRQKAKGNFFRSRKHMLMYLEQHKLIIEEK